MALNFDLNDLLAFRAVAERVKREVDVGNEVAVVVSAMSGATPEDDVRLVRAHEAEATALDQLGADAVGAAPERLGPGDMAFFPAGSRSTLYSPVFLFCARYCWKATGAKSAIGS